MGAVVDYFIHGRGRGHASRFPAVRDALGRRGLSVRVHSGGAALDVLDQRRTSVLPREALARGPLSPLVLALRSLSDTARFAAQHPKLVISDGDQAAILGGRTAGTPVVAIGHDLVFNGGVDLPRLPAGAMFAQRANALPTRAATRGIAVHFLPATSHDPHIRVARPETVRSGVTANDRQLPIVCYFRDRNGLQIARHIARRGHDVMLFGDSVQDEPGISVQPFCSNGFRRALAKCSAVVASAGSNLLAECALLGKPILATYRRDDGEQWLNAILAEQAGIAVASELGDAPAATFEFLARVRRGDFARIDLERALPPLSAAVAATLDELQIADPVPEFGYVG